LQVSALSNVSGSGYVRRMIRSIVRSGVGENQNPGGVPANGAGATGVFGLSVPEGRS
jgi:hypothetical protein